MSGTGVCLVASERREIDDVEFSRRCQEIRPKALRYAAGMLTVDRGRAEDLVQEAMLRMHAARGRYQPDAESFRRYVFRILTNICLDELRRRRTGSLALEEARGISAGQRDDSPDHEMLRRERHQAVTRAIESLPVRERAALLLREFGGQSYAQIAEEMHTTVTDVTNLIHRARTLFTREMRPWMD